MTESRYPLATTTWDHEELNAIQRVVESGSFTMGSEVSSYEKDFASFFDSKYAVMSNSGSSANLLAMAAIRYSSLHSDFPKNEIIVPAVSWSTTYYPISQMGYKLKFVDVSPATLNADVKALQSAIGPQTAGIFVVNLLGNPSALRQIRDICDEQGLFMIEDNCESMGALDEGKFAGTYGHIGTFSSFFSHHISTMEGGMCLTDSLELAQIMTSLRAHGWTRELPTENFVHNKSGDPFEDSFRFVLPGYNLRPLEFEGAIGKEQLKKLPQIISGRRANAVKFLELISQYPAIRYQEESGESSWFGFSMILDPDFEKSRDDLVGILSKNRIDVRPIVAGNFTRNPVVGHLSHTVLETYPNADLIHDHGLFIGNHHYDLTSELQLLDKVLAEFFA
jgi:CDP-6-deoxy-D-xylo-4-hexulose-3-dehydrase